MYTICGALGEITPALDVILIIRGGGNKSDLNYLNNETLAKTICESPLPIYVGVGHQIDKTLLDDVACMSFPTPSLVASYLRENIINRAYEIRNFLEIIQREASTRLKDKDSQYNEGWTSLCHRITNITNLREKEAVGYMNEITRIASGKIYSFDKELVEVNGIVIQGTKQGINRHEGEIISAWKECYQKGISHVKLLEADLESLMSFIENCALQRNREIKDKEKNEQEAIIAMQVQKEKHKKQIFFASVGIAILIIIIMIMILLGI